MTTKTADRKRRTPWEVKGLGRGQFEVSYAGTVVLTGDSTDVYNYILGRERGRVDVVYESPEGLSARMTLEEALEFGL